MQLQGSRQAVWPPGLQGGAQSPSQRGDSSRVSGTPQKASPGGFPGKPDLWVTQGSKPHDSFPSPSSRRLQLRSELLPACLEENSVLLCSGGHLGCQGRRCLPRAALV